MTNTQALEGALASEGLHAEALIPLPTDAETPHG